MKKIILFKSILFSIAMFSISLLQSCKKDTPPTPDDQELITTVQLKFTSPTGAVSSFEWKDIDGAGGKEPEIDTIKLNQNLLYNLDIAFIDDSKNPPENITTEIKEENTAHLVLVTVTNALNWVITSLDKDENNKPLGLTQTVQTSQASNGVLNLVLLHQSDKNAADPSKTGETDIEVTLPVVVK
jgi:hypothetical protein